MPMPPCRWRGWDGPARAALAVALLAGAARAQVSTGKYLYTPPDPSASGGMRGEVTAPAQPIVEVFAVPPDEPSRVYRGRVLGAERRQFEFAGLPNDRYDLCMLFAGVFCEGLTLRADGDTLSDEDRPPIEAAVARSEPFFNRKILCRLEGASGDGAEARGLWFYERTSGSIEWSGQTHSRHRRSIKLVRLKDVGPGWQIVTSRELDVRFFSPGERMRHVYAPALGRIRVVDAVKDLGKLELER